MEKIKLYEIVESEQFVDDRVFIFYSIKTVFYDDIQSILNDLRGTNRCLYENESSAQQHVIYKNNETMSQLFVLAQKQATDLKNTNTHLSKVLEEAHRRQTGGNA